MILTSWNRYTSVPKLELWKTIYSGVCSEHNWWNYDSTTLQLIVAWYIADAKRLFQRFRSCAIRFLQFMCTIGWSLHTFKLLELQILIKALTFYFQNNGRQRNDQQIIYRFLQTSIDIPRIDEPSRCSSVSNGSFISSIPDCSWQMHFHLSAATIKKRRCV